MSASHVSQAVHDGQEAGLAELTVNPTCLSRCLLKLLFAPVSPTVSLCFCQVLLSSYEQDTEKLALYESQLNQQKARSVLWFFCQHGRLKTT